MKKNYLLTMLSLVFCFAIQGQTIINYTQQTSSYDATFADGTAGVFNNGITEVGMYANGGAKQVATWKNFTDDGTTSGNASTMNVGDIFKISLSAYQAYGQIGISLLSSPSATATWDDRINNYAVQVNLNGNSGAYDPWEIISSEGLVNASVINGSDSGTINEFIFTFTLMSPKKMEVIIERTNNTPASFIQTVTINNSNISGYSIYLADDWDNNDNQNTYWKPITEYTYANVWDGSKDNNWADADNWSSNSIPTASSNIRIPGTGITNYPTATATVEIDNGYIESGATLKADDTFTGSITYERYLGTLNWYLVSSPLSGEIMTDMRANNSFADNGGEISFAPYDNSQAVSADRWSYFSNTATDGLENGRGYSTKIAPIGNIIFVGSLNTDAVPFTLTQGGVSGTNFNLLGNPFLTFINGDTFLTNETEDLTSATAWLWNQSTGTYDTKTPGANPGFTIAPGQGFFVEAGSTNSVSFTEGMQTHASNGTFQKATNRPDVFLKITDGTNKRKARVLYDNNATTDFDNGYDGKMFNGVAQNFAVYTQLLTNNDGINYAVQMLPNSDLETLVVPVGVQAAINTEITFSVEALNLPAGLKVFLEDRTVGLFIRLDETNSEYKITPSEALNGTGRFYLHTSQKALSIDTSSTLENVRMYKADKSTLRIVGLQQGAATVKLFNLLGKQVMNSSFTTNNAQNISLPQLAKGVYIVQLTTVTGKLNKKIVLE